MLMIRFYYLIDTKDRYNKRTNQNFKNYSIINNFFILLNKLKFLKNYIFYFKIMRINLILKHNSEAYIKILLILE